MTVFGFIDRAVVDDPTLAPKVAELLPAYDQGAAGWYDGVSEWIPEALQAIKASSKRGAGKRAATAGSKTTASARAAAPPPPDVKTALTGFASLSDDQLADEGLGPRQLLALTTLGRIWPSIAQTHTPLAQQLDAANVAPDDLVQALVPLTPDGDPATAKQLLSLLVHQPGPAGPPGLAGQPGPPKLPWDDLLDHAVHEGLIKPSIANSQCTPCYVTIKQTQTGAAVAYVTHQEIIGVAMKDFDDLFDPPKWTNYSPPWCAMTQESPIGGHNVYLEVLSVDCAANPPPVFSLSTPLEFMTGDLPDLTGKVLQYRLPPNWSTFKGGDGLVSVDEGSIVVRKWKGSIHLITTKRVQFRLIDKMPALEAAWIAQFVWAMGYSAQADYFVNRVCHLKHAKVVKGKKISSKDDPDPGPFQQLGEVWKHEVGEWVDGIESSLGKVTAGDYDAAEYVKDVGKFVKHVASYGAGLLGIVSGSGGTKQQGKNVASSKGRYVSEPLLLGGGPGVAAQATGSSTLEVSSLAPGLMQSASDEIAAQIVQCQPAQVGPKDEYRLVVEEKSLQFQPGGTYTGTVKATTGPNLAAVSSPAWIVLP
jgi:hypothetical protein